MASGEVTKQLVNHRRFSDEPPIDFIEVGITVGGQPYLEKQAPFTDAQQAVAILLGDLSSKEFEPPLPSVSEDDILISIDGEFPDIKVVARYMRTDATTTNTPDGYQRGGAPLTPHILGEPAATH